MPATRQLAAIMFTDIVGYTALMGSDEEKALEMLRRNRQIHKTAIENHQGKWLKEIGDAVLAQFNSAVNAVRCAHEIQREAQDLGAKIRIGIHLGDVTVENNDVFGDGVNIASRIQSIADPGGIYITDAVHQAIRSQAGITTRYLGAVSLKNVEVSVGTYCLVADFLPVPSKAKVKSLVDAKDRRVKTWMALALCVLAGIVSIALWRYFSTDRPLIRSLVVLPVANRTGDPDISLYADGIHDAIINEIAKVTALRVPSTRTSLKYRDSKLSVPEIARELNVDGVIEPSLFMLDDSIKIRINLIAPEPVETQLWSEEFTRDMPHVLSLFAEVASSLARELDIELTDQQQQVFTLASQTEVVPQAYEAYVKGMSYWYRLTQKDLDQALRYFQLATEIDPDYAPAYAGIAMVWGGRLQQGMLPLRDVADTLELLMKKALTLDSTLVEVNYTYAVMSTWWKWDWEEAGKAFKKTIALAPNHAGARMYYSQYLFIVGKPQEALAQGQKALELDPVSSLFQSLYGMDLNYARRYDEAIAQLSRTLETTPNDPVALATLRSVYHNTKQFDKAYEMFVQSYEVRGDSSGVAALRYGYEEGGYRQALIRLAEQLIARSKERYVTPNQIATLYARAGQVDKAIHYLNLSFDDHDANMPHIHIDPIYDDFRQDPRFQELVDRMKFPGL